VNPGALDPPRAASVVPGPPANGADPGIGSGLSAPSADGPPEESLAAVEAAPARAGGGGPAPRRPRRAPTKMGRWSRGEWERLLELYGTRPDAVVARMLGRTVASVRRMAERGMLPVRRPGRAPWSEDEERRLKSCLGMKPLPVIARMFGRSETEILAKERALSASIRRGPWTSADVRNLKAHYGSREDRHVAILLGRAVADVRRAAKALHLAKDKAFVRRLALAKGTLDPLQRRTLTEMPRWNAEQIQKLRALYPDHSNDEIAAAVRRSVKSVLSKAHELRLRKSPQRLREMGASNVGVRYGARPPAPALRRTVKPGARARRRA
jgi:hypothetical protein